MTNAKTDAAKKRREGSVITVLNDEKAGFQMFNVVGMPTLYLYHTPQPDGPAGLCDAIKAHAAYHGMEQRIRDAGALGYNEELGRYATPQEKYLAMKELVDYYNSGADVWSLRGGISEGSLLFRALMREKADRNPTTVKEWIAKQDQAAKDGKIKKGWRTELLDSDRLIEIVRAIRKEDGKVIDADAMLDSLDA